jgi:hypothetical protein
MASCLSRGIDAGVEAFDRVVLDQEVELEHLGYGLADVDLRVLL